MWRAQHIGSSVRHETAGCSTNLDLCGKRRGVGHASSFVPLCLSQGCFRHGHRYVPPSLQRNTRIHELELAVCWGACVTVSGLVWPARKATIQDPLSGAIQSSARFEMPLLLQNINPPSKSRPCFTASEHGLSLVAVVTSSESYSESRATLHLSWIFGCFEAVLCSLPRQCARSPTVRALRRRLAADTRQARRHCTSANNSPQ